MPKNIVCINSTWFYTQHQELCLVTVRVMKDRRWSSKTSPKPKLLMPRGTVQAGTFTATATFSNDELIHRYCTKPVHQDLCQLDTEHLWAIKCRNFIFICTMKAYGSSLGHVGYRYPLREGDTKTGNKRLSRTQ